MGLTGSRVNPECCVAASKLVEGSGASPFPKRRNCTDVICLLLLLIYLSALVGLLIYCIKYGDIDRITKGYDRCGNICGKVTERIGIAPDDPKYTCFGADMRKNGLLQVTGAGRREMVEVNINRVCVPSCSVGYREFCNRCIPKDKPDKQLGPNPPGPNGDGGGSVGNSGGGSSADEQKRRYMSAQLIKQPAILVRTKNKGFPDLLLPLNKGSRFRRQVEVVRRRRLLQYRQQQWPLDPFEQIDIYFSKSGYPNFFQEVAEDFVLYWPQLVALFFISLGFAVSIMLLLLIAVKVVVILSLVAGIIVCLAATAYLWAQWAYERDSLTERYRFYPQSMSKIEKKNVDSYLGYAIAATVIIVVLFLVLLVSRKRLGLVIRLFEEAGRAISDMPTLLILPWVSFALVGGLIATWYYFSLWIESSGWLVSENNVNFFYEKDGVALVARWWNLLALFFLIQFVMACQHLVVAGAVGDWYFTRDKVNLRSPVDQSMARTVSNHLGTAVFGAALVPILHFIRAMYQEVYRWFKPTVVEQRLVEGVPSVVINQTAPSSIFNCLMFPYVKFIAFVSRNSYIEVALTGCIFIEGGRRATRLIAKNAFDIAAINSAGDFVLFVAKTAVMLGTMLVAIVIFQDKEGVMHVWVPVTLAAIFGYAVAHIFITVYEEFVEDCNPKTHKRYKKAKKEEKCLCRKCKKLEEKNDTKQCECSEKPDSPICFKKPDCAKCSKKQESPKFSKKQDSPKCCKESDSPKLSKNQDSPKFCKKPDCAKCSGKQDCPKRSEKQDSPKCCKKPDSPNFCEKHDSPKK